VTGSGVEEVITVTLLPEKEGLFMFQHRNYEVKSARRGSSVVRRYSDFVWLLDCLQRRFPFRQLPLLPPKRVAGTSTAHLIIAQDPAHLWKSMALTFQRIQTPFSRNAVVVSSDSRMPLFDTRSSLKSNLLLCF
jgi:hypothetical protein